MTNTAKFSLPPLTRMDVMVEVDSGVITDHTTGRKMVRVKLDAGWSAVQVMLSGDQLLSMLNGACLQTEGAVWVPES